MPSVSHPLQSAMPRVMRDFLYMDTPTPFVVIDLDRVRKNYRHMQVLYPNTDIYYAVKANAEIAILQALHDLGASFDVASVGEIDRVLKLGVSPHKLSYSNTVKKASEIAYAYDKGVRKFAYDCVDEVQKIAENAPNAEVFCRVMVDCHGAEWPLSRKFGCDVNHAVPLLQRATDLGLQAVGVSIHVGSQQMTLTAWQDALRQVKAICDRAKSVGIEIQTINLGGGMCCHYDKPIIPHATYAAAIRAYIDQLFGDNVPTLLLEPGRSLVGDAGVLKTEVITVAHKTGQPTHLWVYIDAGIMNGLFEALDEAITYTIITAAELNGETVPKTACVLAGPSCDTADILYNSIRLPSHIQSGDMLFVLSAGAYTNSYACAWFNGFPPLKTYFVDSQKLWYTV